MNRPTKIFLGLGIGTLAGLICFMFFQDNPYLLWSIKNVAQPIGQVFLRLIFMAVVPLVFSSLVLGVFELGDVRSIGRVGSKTLLYTIFASVTSVLIGIVLVSAIRPGSGLEALRDSANLATAQSSKVIEQAGSSKGLVEILVNLIPKNPMDSALRALDGEMVSLMIFALIFGLALAQVKSNENESTLANVLSGLRDVSMKMVDFAMAFAPLGVLALMFSLTAQFGWPLLASLSKYVVVVILGLAVQQFVVFGALLKFYCKRSPMQFLSQIKEVAVTAFSTASSNATLPTSIQVAENKLGIDRKIASFVLTIGSTANQNGTALFEGVTILFLAQVFGIDLSLTQQITVMFMSVVAGVGTAGVPGGSIPLIVIVLQSVGIPPEGIGLVLGVDRLLDMCRTVLNVTGDLVAAVVIDASEKKEALPESAGAASTADSLASPAL